MANYTDFQIFFIEIISNSFVTMCNDLYSKCNVSKNTLRLDEPRVASVVVQIEKDYHRMADYNGISPDRNKQAGFLTYWMCKIKPVVIANPDEIYKKAPKVAFVLDEFLAICCSISMIRAANVIIVNKKIETGEKLIEFDRRIIDIKQIKAILYDLLHYLQKGNITSLSLAILYYYIDVTASNHEYLEYIK